MGVDERMKWYQRGACPFATIVLLMIILLPMSFHNVEYDEMAFYKRRSTGTISRDKVYEAGRYFIGPDGEFVKFPASLQTVDFKGLSVWTKTQTTAEGGGQGAAGTAVKLDVSFQYRLRPAELSSLYSAVALTFRPFIENLATTTIKNISTSYTANEWTENRKEIQKAMLTGIDTALENAHADCELVQLRKIEFPPTFIERMLAAAVQIQSNQAEESLQRSQLIRSETALKVKEVENDASVVANTAKAQAALKIVEAQQRVQQEKNEAEKFKQQAAITRSTTAQQVAEIENQAWLVNRKAQAEADKIRALAQNEATKKLEQARTEGLEEISSALGWTTSGDLKYLMSLDYIFKLVESSADPESKLETFLGLPADLRTVATTTT
eukprot:Tamp_07265.p1 GENE.Tamp_07265~~Tamp_07265.p1  ORF type:complete len:383 (-),score=109.13 Tamp_07265:1354-2502(-)